MRTEAQKVLRKERYQAMTTEQKSAVNAKRRQVWAEIKTPINENLRKTWAASRTPENLEKHRLRCRDYRENNLEKVKATCRQTRKNIVKFGDIERLNHWRELEAVRSRNRRARIFQVGGKHTAEDVAKIFDLQKGKCSWCLMSFDGEKPHVDHYMPIALGGSNGPKNLRLLHQTCNSMKSSKHPIQFAQQNGLLCW